MPTDSTAPPLGPVVKSAVVSVTLVSLTHDRYVRSLVPKGKEIGLTWSPSKFTFCVCLGEGLRVKMTECYLFNHLKFSSLIKGILHTLSPFVDNSCLSVLRGRNRKSNTDF